MWLAAGRLVLDESDYIVVAAGAAGCLLANRVSASGEHKALLLEAGGTDRNPLIRVPMRAGLLYTAKFLNWAYETVRSDRLTPRSNDALTCLTRRSTGHI